MRFSDATWRSLPTPDTGQKLCMDDTLPGFGLRVSKKAKTFVLTFGAERQRVTIGRCPIVTLSQARDKALIRASSASSTSPRPPSRAVKRSTLIVGTGK